MDIYAIVPAAGSGKRLGAGINKLFLTLADRPVIAWALGALERSDDIKEIIPVFSEADMEKGASLIEEYGFKKIKRLAPGGAERQDSVFNALNLIKGDNIAVLIHDGARPLLDGQLIKEIIKALKGHDGAVAALPAKDTIKEADQKGVVLSTLKRKSLWAVQTPQAFMLGTIKAAYEKAKAEGFYSTDDSALVERAGGKVKLVMGSAENIKITTPEDIQIAEMFLRQKKEALCG